MSVVEKHEPVMLAQCLLCQGSTLYVIERFVTLEDRRDFADQETKGYSIKRMTLQQAGSIGECLCTETALARHMDKKRVEINRPRKTRSYAGTALKYPPEIDNEKLNPAH